MSNPYNIIPISRPRRFEPFWDHRLDQMAKKSSKLYRKAGQTGSDEDWSRYKCLNKGSKYCQEEEAVCTFKKFADGLVRAAPSEATTTNSELSRQRRASKQNTQLFGKALDLK